MHLKRRRTFSIIGLLLVLAFLFWEVRQLYPQLVSEHIGRDFLAYWTAGRLLLTGSNPYSPQQLFVLQRSVGWTEEIPLMLYNPPWTLSYILPFSLQDYVISKLLWLFSSLALVFLCADCAWRFYEGPRSKRPWAFILSFAFAPTLFMINMGQIVSLTLLGVMGFLYFEKHQRRWLAGSTIALIGIKPLLFYLFWIALLLWALDRRNWSVILGGIVSGIGALIIPLIYDPSVINNYLYTMTHQPPHIYWASPTIGAYLRLVFGTRNYWLQFVPSVSGVLWFLFYWQKHKKNWVWGKQMPLLLLVSLITTSYGWSADYAILLPVIIQAAIWVFISRKHQIKILSSLFFILFNGLVMILHFMRLDDLWSFWMVPVLFLFYLTLRRKIHREHLDVH